MSSTNGIRLSEMEQKLLLAEQIWKDFNQWIKETTEPLELPSMLANAVDRTSEAAPGSQIVQLSYSKY